MLRDSTCCYSGVTGPKMCIKSLVTAETVRPHNSERSLQISCKQLQRLGCVEVHGGLLGKHGRSRKKAAVLKNILLER